MTSFKNIKQSLIILFTKIFIRGFSLLSLKNCHRLGALFGWLISITPNRHRFVTTTNIQLCFPDIDSTQQQQLIKNSLIERERYVPFFIFLQNKINTNKF